MSIVSNIPDLELRTCLTYLQGKYTFSSSAHILLAFSGEFAHGETKQLKRIIRERRSAVTNYLWIQLSMTTRAREAAEGWKGVQVGGGRCGLRTDTKTTRQLAAAADAMLPTKKLCSKLNEEVVGETERKL